MKTLHSTIISPIACLLALILCGCQTPPLASKKPVTVTAADLLGTWVGLTEDALNYFRVDLRASGKGLCAYVYVHNEARLLVVTSWATQAGRIEIALSPIDNDPNQVTRIAGTAHMTVMELKVFGKGWQRGLVMRQEDDMERRANLVKTRMKRGRAEIGASRDVGK